MPSFVFQRKLKDGTTKTYFQYDSFEDYCYKTNYPLWHRLKQKEQLKELEEKRKIERNVDLAITSKTVGKALEEAVAEKIKKDILQH